MRSLDVSCPRWGWNLVDGITLHRIRDRLGHYETMTFREIFANDRAGCHPIEVWKLCADAKARIKEIRLDVDELLSLRIQGAERVWGVRTLRPSRPSLVGPSSQGLSRREEAYVGLSPLGL
jgi:hypothetical protein